MSTWVRWVGVCCLSPVASAIAVAADGAHEHGIGDATLAGTGDRLEFRLDVPGDSVFGFEHKPESEAQEKAVADALLTLRESAGDLLMPSGGDCQLTSVSAATPLEGEGHEHEEHEHEEHEHEEHEHEEHGDHDDHGSHSEVVWEVSWHCDSVDDMTAFSAEGLFSAFPRLETVRFQWSLPQGQGAGRLSSSEPEADLSS